MDKYKLACTNYNELIFIANEVINIAIILNAKEYKITQKIEVHEPIKLSILDNKICCTCYYDCDLSLLFEKLGNEYRQIKDDRILCSYRENLKLKNWKIELIMYRGGLLLSINRRRSFHFVHGGHFQKYQKLFIEPSFLILGMKEALIDLEKIASEDSHFENNLFTIQKACFYKRKGRMALL